MHDRDILILSLATFAGGAEAVLAEWLRHQPADLAGRCQVAAAPAPFAQTLHDAGMRTDAWSPRYTAFPGHLRHIAALRQRDRIALVIANGRRATYLASLVRGVQVLSIQHQPLDDAAGGGMKRRLRLAAARRIFSRMDCVIGISDATTASHARCIPPDRLITIRNGVDVDRFAPLEQPTRDSVRRGFRGGPNVLHAVHIGRLEPGKRVDAAIRALPALTSEIVLHLIGDGPERFNLESLARTIGVADRVVFHGVRRDVPSILPAMDVLVMPSESEGLPLVILEAMACGVTVIASRVGGIPEIVHDGRTGLLIPPGDAQALAVALARLHDDPALRGQLALGGRALALAEHRIEDVAQRFWNLCRERLAATGQASPCG